jgi:UDPglucose--hexose-1-phosphate uridylyltransferase
MSEHHLQRNALSGKWTVLVPGRRLRPPDGASSDPCPFCAGNEHLTPPEIEAIRPRGGAADGPGWTVRVVPNKFPVFADGHEVVVHSPDHRATLAALPEDHVVTVLSVCQRRLAALRTSGTPAVALIVNQGFGAGASLAHPHTQLFATPIVPPTLLAELDNFALYETKHDGCLLCDLMARARDEGDRLVLDGDVIAWTPRASRWPFELWLAPRRHEADFGTTDPRRLAGPLRRVLAAVATATGDAALNWWVHTVPCRHDGPFHWHVELTPRLTAIAGFELATDVAIEVLAPAEAAAQLRGALGRASPDSAL